MRIGTQHMSQSHQTGSAIIAPVFSVEIMVEINGVAVSISLTVFPW